MGPFTGLNEFLPITAKVFHPGPISSLTNCLIFRARGSCRRNFSLIYLIVSAPMRNA